MSYRLAGSGWNQFQPDPASRQPAKPVWYVFIAVYTVLDPWWRTENLYETCRVLFQKNWEISASRWFYYKNISRCTIRWMSNMLKWFWLTSKQDKNSHADKQWQVEIGISCSNSNFEAVECCLKLAICGRCVARI